MRATPHSPSFAPTFDQTTVRGASRIYRSSNETADRILVSWPGLIENLDRSPGWPVVNGGTYTEAAVVFETTAAAVTFRILINGAVAATINTSASGALQLFAINLTTARDDRVSFDLTNFGTGLGEDMSVSLRRST